VAAEAGNANTTQAAVAAPAAEVEAVQVEQQQPQTQQIVASSSEMKAALEAAPAEQPEASGVADAVNVVRGNRAVKNGELAIQPAAPEQQSSSALPVDVGLGLLALALVGAGIGGVALFVARRRRSA
jgi:hypothetical protein